MRRVTTKQKRAKRSAASSAHLVFTSQQHKIDREAADRLRGRARMPTVERVSRDPFPNGEKVSFQGHFWAGKFERQPEAVFIAENLDVKKQCSWYERKDPRRPKGKPRRESTGILETNVALPVGIGLALSELSKRSPDKVSEFLEAVGLEGMRELERRTGYLGQYLVLHPDSAGTVSFHFGVSPVDPTTHQLVGRSAGGTKGRRGLRLLGDAFMSVLRHSRFVVIPERLIELPKKALSDEGRNEDWEVGLAMEEKALTLGVDLWGPQFKDYAESAGKRMAEDWVRRVQDGGESLRRLEAALADLVIERDDLKAKNDALEARVAILERRIEAMRKTFKDGPDPD